METAGLGEGIRLEIEPGWLKGKADGDIESSETYEVSVQVEKWDPAAREAVLAYLEEDPQALYRLLAGQGAPWLDELAPSPAGRRACRRSALHMRPSGLRACRSLVGCRSPAPGGRAAPAADAAGAAAGSAAGRRLRRLGQSSPAAGRRLRRGVGRPREGEGTVRSFSGRMGGRSGGRGPLAPARPAA